MSRWEWLVNNARLDIFQFNVDRHERFSERNRRYPFYVMSYIQEGYAEAVIDGRHYITPAGSLLLIPKGALHSHYIPQGRGPTTFLWWHFNISVDGLDIMQLVDYPITLEIRHTLAFESLFYSYVEFYGRKKTLPNLILRRAKGLEIMGYLFENILVSSGHQTANLDAIPDVFFRMMQEIIEHPEQAVTLQDLSQRYFMNGTYICNRFKKLFGISPVKLHNNIVVSHAKNLLSGSEYHSVGELAHRLGFSDISAFTRFFTAKVGCSPSVFRSRCYGQSEPADDGLDEE